MSNNNTYAMLTVKLPPARLEEFRIAATLRGTTMSALIQQFVTSVVREEMAVVPQAFRRRATKTTNLLDLIDQGEGTN